MRAQGKPGAHRTRSLVRKIESTRVSHYRYAGRSGLPCAIGFNGFLRARPGDRALLSPWVTTLARCTGYQRRDIRPTRLHRPHRRVSSCNAFASIASRPTFVTMANAPLPGRDGRASKADLPDASSEIFSQKGLDER